MTCYKCNAKNQFANVCRSGSGNRNMSYPSDFKKSHGKGKGKSQKKKVSEVLQDYDYDYDSEEEDYEIGDIKDHTMCSPFPKSQRTKI